MDTPYALPLTYVKYTVSGKHLIVDDDNSEVARNVTADRAAAIVRAVNRAAELETALTLLFRQDIRGAGNNYAEITIHNDDLQAIRSALAAAQPTGSAS